MRAVRSGRRHNARTRVETWARDECRCSESVVAAAGGARSRPEERCRGRTGARRDQSLAHRPPEPGVLSVVSPLHPRQLRSASRSLDFTTAPLGDNSGDGGVPRLPASSRTNTLAIRGTASLICFCVTDQAPPALR